MSEKKDAGRGVIDEATLRDVIRGYNETEREIAVMAGGTSCLVDEKDHYQRVRALVGELTSLKPGQVVSLSCGGETAFWSPQTGGGEILINRPGFPGQASYLFPVEGASQEEVTARSAEIALMIFRRNR